MSTTCHCGATWTGHRIEHCTECHETFTGTTAGDKHRVGQHHLSAGPDRRRCLTADEMRAKGMEQNARGQWTNGGTSPWAKALQPDPEDAQCEADGCINLAPPWDPQRLDHRGPDPEPEVDERRGLDGNGAMSAAELPRTAHTWGYCSPPTEREELDMDEETPVKREKCLKVDPDGDYLMPGRCKKPLGHEPPHDWGANHGAFLGDVRRAELRDTPSDVLPRRVPGEALREAEGERQVIERWPA